LLAFNAYPLILEPANLLSLVNALGHLQSLFLPCLRG
jgi:hypothetical protein